MKTEHDVDVLKRIGERIKNLRIKSGYTSSETFSVKNDLSRVHYGRIEKGTTNITISSLVRILNIHGVTIEEFFTENN